MLSNANDFFAIALITGSLFSTGSSVFIFKKSFSQYFSYLNKALYRFADHEKPAYEYEQRVLLYVKAVSYKLSSQQESSLRMLIT